MESTVQEVLQRHQTLGMIGGELDDHVRHAAAFAAQWTTSAGHSQAPERCVDLGSGGGLPALVLADLWPETRFLLTETRQTRAEALIRAVNRLGWADRVAVWDGDVQDAAKEANWRHQAEVVTARSFATPALTAECGREFLLPGGVLIVSEPPAASTADRWPEDKLALLGYGPATVDPGPPRFMCTAVSPLSAEEARTATSTPVRRRRTMERQPRW